MTLSWNTTPEGAEIAAGQKASYIVARAVPSGVVRLFVNGKCRWVCASFESAKRHAEKDEAA